MDPAGHEMQLLVPEVTYFPASQLTQDSPPPVSTVKTGFCPGPQSAQTTVPAVSAYVPSGQAPQALFPMSEAKVETSQRLQVVEAESELERLPATQGVHAASPGASVYVPPAHSAQVEAEEAS